MVQCPKCGFENFDHARKCIDCKHPLIDPGEALPPPPPLQAADIEELRHYKPLVMMHISITEILSHTFSIFSSHIIPFFSLTFLAHIPLLALRLATLDFIPNRADPDEVLSIVLAQLALAILPVQLATAGVTFGVLQHLRQRRFTFASCLVVGLRVMVLVIAVAVLQTIAIMAGMMACIIPGIYLMVIFAVAIPAAVEERQGPISALRRSVVLTRDYRQAVFGVLFLLGLINFALGIIAGILTGLIGNSEAVVVVAVALQALTTAVGAVAQALLYYRLRSIKESIDIEELASVFD